MSTFKCFILLAITACCAPCFASISISPPVFQDTVPNSGNNFNTQLTALGFNAIVQGSLTADIAGTIDFFFHGQESGWNNSFTAKNQDDSVAATVSESSSLTPWIPGGTYIGTLVVAAGDVLKLSFDSNNGAEHAVGTPEFGIFAKGTGTGAGFSLTTLLGTDGRLYFGHDDNGAGPDDNHDDIVISAKFTPVPEATSLLAWGAMLLSVGLVARRSYRRQSRS